MTFILLTAICAGTASAQVSPGGTGTPGGSPTITPVTPPAGTPTDSTSSTQAGGGTIGALVAQPRAAIPLPNPNLAYNSALPNQRGFIRAEPFFIYPYLGVGIGHNDNLTGTRDNKISSALLALTPRISADLKSGAHTHSLVYQGNYGRYTGSHADDYTEHELIGRTVNQFTARADLAASIYYLDRSDPRALLARVASDTPDRWHAFGANGTFGYGARNAPGRVEFDLAATDKTYQNNREVTRFFDVSTANAAGRFLYRVAPRTRLLAEARYTTFDYKDNPIDNHETRLLVGATWDLAASTSGTFKIGEVRKQFKEGTYQDFNAVNVEGAVRWMPRTYSTIDLVVTRQPNDVTGTGFIAVDTALGAVWTHRWRSYLTTRALASYVNSDFRQLARTDKLSTIGVGGYFDIRTWLRLGAELTHQQRDSTVDILTFRRNVIMFTVAGTL